MKNTSRSFFLVVVLLISAASGYSQWVKSKLPSNVTYVNSIVGMGANIFTGTWGGGPGSNVYRSSDNGTSWATADSSGGPTYISALAVSGSMIFAATYGGGIDKSTDNGASWANADSGLIDSMYSNVISLVDSGSTMYTGLTGNSEGTHNGRLYKSVNNGRTWAEIDTGLYPDSLVYAPYAMAVSGANLVVGGGHDESIMLSTNNGASWSLNSTMTNYGTVRCLAANGSKVAAGTDDGVVLLSTDSGVSWAAIDSGFAAGVYSLAWSRSDIFAGTSSGCLGEVYLLTYNGSTWDSSFTGLLSSYVLSLAVVGNDLFAGTYSEPGPTCANDTGPGVWRRPLSELITTSVPRATKGIPKQYALAQSYPNPFNPTATIGYELPKASFVHLSIYNVLGQEVRTLVNQTQQAGYKTVQFDGGGMASGVYFYRITAGSFSDVKRMVFLK